MSKTKNSISAASVAAKIGLALVLVFLLGMVIYFATKCEVAPKQAYYECEIYQYHYVNGTTPKQMDMLDGVEYCHLYVNDDDTFSLKWKYVNSENVITEVGTYTKKGKEYTFKYSGFPQLGLQQEFHLTLNGKTFEGNEQFESTTKTIYTVVSKFSK